MRTHWSTELPGGARAARLARVQARTALTVAGWPVSVPLTAHVAGHLVDNAVHHGLAVAPRLHLTFDGRQLIVDVEDPTPAFEDFAATVHLTRGGLREIQQLGAALSWFLRNGQNGKTVRATVTSQRVAP